MLSRVPPFVRRLLVVGANSKTPVPVWRGARVEQVANAKEASPGPYECILLIDSDWSTATLEACYAKLSDNGYLLLSGPAHPSQDKIGAGANDAGFCVYEWDTNERSVATLVKAGYDPIEHAMAFRRAGRPDWCYEVLVRIPFEFRSDPEAFVLVETEKQFALLDADASENGDRRLERFWQAQMCFYDIVHVLPDEDVAYQCQAEMWGRLGDTDMAARLLRSIAAVHPSEGLSRRLDAVESLSMEEQQVSSMPRITFFGKPLRVLLLLNSERPDYGVDTLYDGLCRMLGPDNVTEFPHKPSLHGYRDPVDPNKWDRYPCLFDWPDKALAQEQLISELRAGRFDCILFCDLGFATGPEELRAVLNAAEAVPLFVLDQEDSPFDNVHALKPFLDVDKVVACFKREMLRTVDYGPRFHPMPFAFPDGRVNEAPAEVRNRPLFWAGHRRYGLRRLYVDYLEQVLGLPLNEGFSPSEYGAAVRESILGLSIFGVGFDTIRYWELPANGCALLAERPPIRIPDNFVDGESALFFGDIPELEAKCRYYLAHLDEARAIGRAGHAHLKRCHTGTCRARQLLAHIETHLSE